MTFRGLAVGLLPCALACGGDLAAGPHEEGGEGGSSSFDAGAASDRSAEEAESGATYSGTVIASITSSQGNETYALEAAFWTAAPPDTTGRCSAAGVTKGSCCEEQVVGSLPGSPVAPVAGNVTIDLHGLPLATLLSPDYAPIDSATWQPGDDLGVSAAGGDVAAFSGTLATPAMVLGLSPPFGTAPVAIAHDADFRISWTPDGASGALMQLQIDSIESSGALEVILCTVQDSAGSIVVDASLLEPLVSAGNTSTSASIHLTRSITSSVAAANASIALEGDLWLSDRATLQ
jgi:hypothetical protein